MKKIHLKIKRKTKWLVFICIIFVSTFLCIVLLKVINTKIVDIKYNENKIQNLQKEINSLNEQIKNASSIKISDDMSDDDYEKIARDELGLAKRDEIILIPESNNLED